MRLACSTVGFPQDPPAMAMARVAWAGYGWVELAAGPDPPPDAEAMLARLRAEELQLAAVHAGELSPSDECLARIGRAAALARGLDGAQVVITTAPDVAVSELAVALGRLDTALGDLPVDLCLANRAGTSLSTPDDLQALWALDLPARVGLALDPGHARLAGWDPTDLEALPELPRYAYLNDASAGRITPPGDGDLDLPGLAHSLRLHGFGGVLCVTLEGAEPWAAEPVARELREAACAWFSIEE